MDFSCNKSVDHYQKQTKMNSGELLNEQPSTLSSYGTHPYYLREREKEKAADDLRRSEAMDVQKKSERKRIQSYEELSVDSRHYLQKYGFI